MQFFEDNVDFTYAQRFSQFEKSVQAVHIPESHVKDITLLTGDLIAVNNLAIWSDEQGFDAFKIALFELQADDRVHLVAEDWAVNIDGVLLENTQIFEPLHPVFGCLACQKDLFSKFFHGDARIGPEAVDDAFVNVVDRAVHQVSTA